MPLLGSIRGDCFEMAREIALLTIANTVGNLLHSEVRLFTHETLSLLNAQAVDEGIEVDSLLLVDESGESSTADAGLASYLFHGDTTAAEEACIENEGANLLPLKVVDSLLCGLRKVGLIEHLLHAGEEIGVTEEDKTDYDIEYEERDIAYSTEKREYVEGDDKGGETNERDEDEAIVNGENVDHAVVSIEVRGMLFPTLLFAREHSNIINDCGNVRHHPKETQYDFGLKNIAAQRRVAAEWHMRREQTQESVSESKGYERQEVKEDEATVDEAGIDEIDMREREQIGL